MPTKSNARLYDISTRLAFYVEGVKANQVKQFDTTLREVSKTLTDAMKGVRYATLDAMSKAQLNRLIVSLRSAQSRIYSRFTNDLLGQIRDFTEADLEVNRRVYASNDGEVLSDEAATEAMKEEEGENRILPLFWWRQVVNNPIPANGLFLLPFIKAFSISSQAATEAIIRKGYANGWTVEETLNALLGEPGTVQGSSQIVKIRNNAAVVIETAIAHAAAVVSAGVSSAFFGKYAWVSVIDAVTTDICRSRNGNVYVYGKGPLPPAHMRCRSHTIPVASGTALRNDGMNEWLAWQPASFRSDIGTVKDGKLQAKPLTVKQFRSKVGKILE
jgi:SPP1 gp7 family putative phage head morphogenesis protein